MGGGGNTDVCPGRQIPSRRHWMPVITALVKLEFIAVVVVLDCHAAVWEGRLRRRADEVESAAAGGAACR